MFHRTLACLPLLTGAWAERGGGIAKSVGSYTEGHIDGWPCCGPTSNGPTVGRSPARST